MSEELYLTTKEVATIVKRDERTVRRWCQEVDGPLHVIAIRDSEGQWRIPQSWVDQWLTDHTDDKRALAVTDTRPILAEDVLERLAEKLGPVLAPVIAEKVNAAVSEAIAPFSEKIATIQSEMQTIRARADVAETKRDQQNVEFAKSQMELRRELEKANRPWWRKLLG